MSTLRDLLTAAYRKINVVGQGTPLDANMVTNGLYALDIMQDSWSNERLMIYSIKPYIFSTQPNKQEYTMGPANDTPGQVQAIALPLANPGTGYVSGTYNNVPASYVTSGLGTGLMVNVIIDEGSVIDVQIVDQAYGINYSTSDVLTVATSYIGGGSPSTTFSFSPAQVSPQTDWVITRPMMIERAYTIWNDPLSAQAVDIPITLLTMEQYASISVKNTPSTFAFALYDDNNWPTRNITLFPIPTNQVAIRFWLRQPLIDATYAALDVPIQYPPGYERAFLYNLCLELAPEYGKSVTPEIQKNALEAKEAIARLNQKPMYKRGDGGLGDSKQGYFNWITGDFFNWRQ